MRLHDVTTCKSSGFGVRAPSGRRLAGVLGKQWPARFSRAESLLLFGQQGVVAFALLRREETVELLSGVVHHRRHSRPGLFANGVRRLELVPENRVGYRALPRR